MDADCDDILDYADNCPNDYNLFQEDTYLPGGNDNPCNGDFNGDGNLDAYDVTFWKKSVQQALPCLSYGNPLVYVLTSAFKIRFGRLKRRS